MDALALMRKRLQAKEQRVIQKQKELEAYMKKDAARVRNIKKAREGTFGARSDEESERLLAEERAKDRRAMASAVFGRHRGMRTREDRKMKFCAIRLTMSGDFLQAYRRLRARSADEVCFWWWRDGKDTAKRTRSTGGNAARLPLCTVEHDVDSQTHAASSAQTLGMPTSARRFRCMHGSCRRAAGCGAGTRRGGVRGLCTHYDEADLIARQRALTETVQELGDLTGHPIVLVGNADLASRLDMHLGFSRRIWELLEFRPATIRDVGNLARSLCRYRIADDLAALAMQSERRAHLCA